MERQAALLISFGYGEEVVRAAMERYKQKKKEELKAKKKEYKEAKVKEALACAIGRPKILRWYQSHMKAKDKERCDVEECPTSAVRHISIQYENKYVVCHMCLSHFNIAHRILTELP